MLVDFQIYQFGVAACLVAVIALIAMLRGGAAGGPIVVGAPAGPADPAGASVSAWWLIAATVWLVGALLVIARANLRERKTLAAAKAAPDAPADAQALLAELVSRHRWPTRIRLVTRDITGPHVVGVVRPIIVIPPALVAHRELLRAALLHELAHVRRFDAVGRVIQLIARAAFWWFPVVAHASRRLDAARESACDARALEGSQLSPPAYARLLLQMAQLRPAAAPMLAAKLDHRIDSVLGPPMRSRLHVVHYLALLGFGAMALGGARSAEARGTETCVYSAQLAEALRLAHPEADLDNDGVLSHDEACEFQAELRHADATLLDQTSTELLSEPLCCNAEAPAAPEASCRAAD